ncbi:adenylyltransferase/cytidyltransferase family protein [Dyella sp. 2RAB6]|uniref:adenylyltransferase/cytidyltransferase family protein n=1 Tax=Dyella sp. 2RAB6 TaxID=3232992 RepID=UPI003F907BA1
MIPARIEPCRDATGYRRVITFGTFDVLHVGHLHLLKRARQLGATLIVGVSSDALSFCKKGRRPIYDQQDRMRIVASLRCVDGVFIEEALERKRDYIREHRADLMVMGDDWLDRFNDCADLCDVRYLKRTPSISTTEIIEIIRHG